MYSTNIIDVLGWGGTFDVVVKENGIPTEEHHINNRLTNAALNKIINILDNIDPDLDIKYVAIGTSNAALNDTDTQLGAEIFRAQFDTSDNTATGTFVTTFTVLDSEAVGDWEEIGIFCGDSATGTANTGTMLSRILFSRTKTALEEISITRTDKVVRN